MPFDITDPDTQAILLKVVQELFTNDLSTLSLEEQSAPSFESAIQATLPKPDPSNPDAPDPQIFGFDYEYEGTEKKLFFSDYNTGAGPIAVTAENFAEILEQIYQGHCYLELNKRYLPFHTILSDELGVFSDKIAKVADCIGSDNRDTVPIVEDYLWDEVELTYGIKNHSLFKVKPVATTSELTQELKTLNLLSPGK